MSVPKSHRKPSKFQASHKLSELRREVTALVENQFGFDSERYEKDAQRYADRHKDKPNFDQIMARYRKKKEAFVRYFIPEERKVIIEMLRDIAKEFHTGNSIWPTRNNPAKIDEYTERRLHMDKAIAACHVLKHELEFVIETLPVNINKFERFSNMIDEEIALIKGVRTSDNRFIKNDGKEDSSKG